MSVKIEMRKYQKKLIGFNNTAKYKLEMEFIKTLIQPAVRIAGGNGNVLDYGCGTGYMAGYLRTETGAEVYGYDKNTYTPAEADPFYYRKEFHFKFDKIYFMHSLAHIEDVKEKLLQLQDEFLNPGSMIYVNTPNFEWMDLKKNKEYKPDTTVIQHFEPESLENLFISCGYKIEYQGQFGDQILGVHERLFLTAKL